MFGKDKAKLSLPESRTVCGYEIKKMPIGAYLRAAERLGSLPEGLISACFPGKSPAEVLDSLTQIAKDGLANIIGAFIKGPSLIILDVEMPGMNGFDAARKLRNSTEYRDIPIIFLTAHTNPEIETEGFDVGAVDYIYKPVLAKTLLMRVETQIMLKNQKRDIMKLQETILKLQETTSRLQERIMRMSVGAEAV